MKYFGNWKSYNDVKRDFFRNDVAPTNFPKPAEVILACYCYEDYSGAAILVWERDGQLYECNGLHCSCNGLEECWNPEATSHEALGMRSLSGYFPVEFAKAFLKHFGVKVTPVVNTGTPTQANFNWRERVGCIIDHAQRIGSDNVRKAVNALLYEYDDLPRS